MADRDDGRRLRAEIEANRSEFQRDDRRGARIFVGVMIALAIATALLAWSQP